MNPMVMASSQSITKLLSMSPGNNVIVGFEVVPPAVIVTGPMALRKPRAWATILYVPAGAVRLNVPSGFANATATGLLSGSNRSRMTGLPASTSPVIVPVVGTDVTVAVGDGPGEGVNVETGDSLGVAEGVCDTSDVGVGTALAR